MLLFWFKPKKEGITHYDEVLRPFLFRAQKKGPKKKANLSKALSSRYLGKNRELGFCEGQSADVMGLKAILSLDTDLGYRASKPRPIVLRKD